MLRLSLNSGFNHLFCFKMFKWSLLMGTASLGNTLGQAIVSSMHGFGVCYEWGKIQTMREGSGACSSAVTWCRNWKGLAVFPALHTSISSGPGGQGAGPAPCCRALCQQVPLQDQPLPDSKGQEWHGFGHFQCSQYLLAFRPSWLGDTLVKGH